MSGDTARNRRRFKSSTEAEPHLPKAANEAVLSPGGRDGFHSSHFSLVATTGGERAGDLRRRVSRPFSVQGTSGKSQGRGGTRPTLLGRTDSLVPLPRRTTGGERGDGNLRRGLFVARFRFGTRRGKSGTRWNASLPCWVGTPRPTSLVADNWQRKGRWRHEASGFLSPVFGSRNASGRSRGRVGRVLLVGWDGFHSVPLLSCGGYWRSKGRWKPGGVGAFSSPVFGSRNAPGRSQGRGGTRPYRVG